MPDTFPLFMIGCLGCFAVVTWVCSRKFGLLGLIAAHFLVIIGYLLLLELAIRSGHYEYDGLLSVIGILVQCFLINCLLLPVGVWGMWRWRKLVRDLQE